jgi:hypothetical protein
MRGKGKVVPSRAYLEDVHWLLGVAAKLTSDTGRAHGAADAIAWARREMTRLQRQVVYLETDRAALLRKVNELVREKSKWLQFEGTYKK